VLNDSEFTFMGLSCDPDSADPELLGMAIE